MKHGIFTGTVAHKRYLPVEHCFQYPFFMWFLNLDELERIPYLGRWFSMNKWALSRFRRTDYYGNRESSLADSIRSRMMEITGYPVKGQVCGLLNLRTLGLYFSPVNFYYGFDDAGSMSHFLAEVSNIPWNERHQYAHYIRESGLEPHQPKEFHVSPFNNEDQHYRWKISEPKDSLTVQIAVDDDRGHVFRADLNLERHPLEMATVRRQLLRIPVMTIYIVASIYWQALKLYRKGVPYVPYNKEMI